MTMPLPRFEFLTPSTVEEAALVLAGGGDGVALVGGGTDLFPNMKRHQVMPKTLVSLQAIPSLRGIRSDDEGRCIIGASTLISEVASSSEVPDVIAIAAGKIASPQIRNVGTVGGNLCLDTRCNYIDMPLTWRKASGACMKEGGEVCWVAPRGNRCWAVSSSDLAPVSVALGAEVRLISTRGERVIAVEDLYQNDGIVFQTKRADEILVELLIPSTPVRASYHKLRRRGSIDFPILGAAAAAGLDDEGTVLWARLVLGAVAPAPMRATEAEQFLVGKRLDDEVIAEAASLAGQVARPQDNTDTGSRYRKWMTSVYMGRALADLSNGGP